MRFYNRDKERMDIKKAFEVFEQNQSISIWIEGRKGIGKTYLLKYIADNYNKHLFKYANNSILYKCSKNNKENDFNYIVSILVVLQHQNREKFNKVIVEYFDSINSLTIKEGLMEFLPQLPGFDVTGKIIEKFNQNITNPKSTIQNIMLNHHLVKCFSDLIKILLQDTHYIFCIDDIVWIDDKSLEVLISLANSQNNFMSFLITTRHYDDFEEEWERQQYDTIHDDLFEFKYSDNHFFEISINNFKREIVAEILSDFNKNYLLDNLEVFYNMTGGNPLEIRNSLKYTDEEIVKKLETYKKENVMKEKNDIRNYLSVEFVSDCMDDNLYNEIILSVLAILDIETPLDLLIIIVKKILENVQVIRFENYLFDKSLKELIEFQEVELNNGYRIRNDSDTEIIISNIINNGNYFEYIKIISIVLFDHGNENSFYYSLLLKICCITSTTLGFNYFKRICAKDVKLTTGIVQYAAKNFQQCFNNVTSENVNKYVVPHVLIGLLNYGKLKDAFSLCVFLYKVSNIMNENSLYLYYLTFVKILVDLGKFNDSEEYSANKIYAELKDLYITDDSQKLEVELVGMTVYEHQNKKDKIIYCFNNATKIINKTDVQLNACICAKYYRNQGLIDFHANLRIQYLKAIKLSTKIENMTERAIMYGTAMNNLGLSYFYSGEIDMAIKCFEKSRKKLLDIGYEIVRPLNNLACCYFILGNNELAYDYINKALEFPFGGVFEQSCVKLNHSLLLIESMDFTSAQDILDTFIKEYENNATQDNWIYSNAYLLQGYADYLLGNYIEAGKSYKKSTYYDSRFENAKEQLRRTTMYKYCLALDGLIEQFPIDEIIDLKNQSYSFYKKPYVLNLLAYYVI